MPVFKHITKPISKKPLEVKKRSDQFQPSATFGKPKPLDVNLQTRMEKVFGTDFSQVRLYKDNSPEQINAQAYTQGHHIHIRPSLYNPASRVGTELLAHELTHVVTQQAGPKLSGNKIASNTYFERIADDNAWHAAQGQKVPHYYGIPIKPTHANQFPIQRKLEVPNKTPDEINNQVDTTITDLKTNAGLPLSAAKKISKIGFLEYQRDVEWFKYSYNSLADLHAYNTETKLASGAPPTAPTRQRTHVGSRVKQAPLAHPGTNLTKTLTSISRYSPSGNGEYKDYYNQTNVSNRDLHHFGKPHRQKSFTAWVQELHDAWVAQYFNTGGLVTDLNLQALDDQLERAIGIASLLDNPNVNNALYTGSLKAGVVWAPNSVKRINVLQAPRTLKAELAGLRSIAIKLNPHGQLANPIVPDWGPLRAGQQGSSVSVTWPLFDNSVLSFALGSGTESEKQSVLPEWFRELRYRKEFKETATSSYWVQGHLLNDWLGGPAYPYNLIPFWGGVNHIHSFGAEENLKKVMQRALNRQKQLDNNPTATPVSDIPTYLEYKVEVGPLGQPPAEHTERTTNWRNAKTALDTLMKNIQTDSNVGNDFNQFIKPDRIDHFWDNVLRNGRKIGGMRNNFTTDPRPPVLQNNSTPEYQYLSAARDMARKSYTYTNGATVANYLDYVPHIVNIWEKEEVWIPNNVQLTIRQTNNPTPVNWKDFPVHNDQLHNKLETISYDHPIKRK
jgi:Domain of unknown function (DUF4157)